MAPKETMPALFKDNEGVAEENTTELFGKVGALQKDLSDRTRHDIQIKAYGTELSRMQAKISDPNTPTGYLVAQRETLLTPLKHYDDSVAKALSADYENVLKELLARSEQEKDSAVADLRSELEKEIEELKEKNRKQEETIAEQERQICEGVTDEEMGKKYANLLEAYDKLKAEAESGANAKNAGLQSELDTARKSIAFLKLDVGLLEVQKQRAKHQVKELKARASKSTESE